LEERKNARKEVAKKQIAALPKRHEDAKLHTV
jgi:hypothetical protein